MDLENFFLDTMHQSIPEAPLFGCGGLGLKDVRICEDLGSMDKMIGVM